jgi:hypothetical protein
MEYGIFIVMLSVAVLNFFNVLSLVILSVVMSNIIVFIVMLSASTLSFIYLLLCCVSLC